MNFILCLALINKLIMKYIFIVTLLCASFVSFSQKYSECGYPFQTFAITAGVARAQTVIAAAPDAYIYNPRVYQDASGSWCYSFSVLTFPPPEPLPKPIPNIAKIVAQSPYNIKEPDLITSR